jgi:CRP-like cAMP-binding protein
LKQLSRASRVDRFPAKSPLFADGSRADTVYLLVKGCVRVDLTSRGGRTPIGFYQQREVVGEEAVYVDIYTMTATSLTDVEAVLIPRDALRAALHADQHFAFAWGRFVHERLIALQMRLGDQGKPSHVKLAAFLLDHANRFGRRQPKTGAVFLPERPTDTVIADYNGVVRQTVQRDYQVLEKRGAIRRADEFYVDLKILAEIADRPEAAPPGDGPAKKSKKR